MCVCQGCWSERILVAHQRAPTTCAVVKGAHCLLLLLCSEYGIEVRHMWGMTELSPLGSLGVPTGVQLAEGMSKEDMIDRKVGI